MPRPLHPSTLAAITKLAQKHGLPLVRADDEAVIIGDLKVVRGTRMWWYQDRICFPGALSAIRHALQEAL